ncbi:Myb-like DNA-binding domain protein [Entophlyctis sp. JEL0112]|nr:Myb-like DNA-binding domain protein [Entophlyctis sp. JEL0112]
MDLVFENSHRHRHHHDDAHNDEEHRDFSSLPVPLPAPAAVSVPVGDDSFFSNRKICTEMEMLNNCLPVRDSASSSANQQQLHQLQQQHNLLHAYAPPASPFFSQTSSYGVGPAFQFVGHPHSLDYLAQMAVSEPFPQELLFHGIAPFFSESDFLNDSLHQSSICMAPSTIFNSNLIDMNNATTPPASIATSPSPITTNTFSKTLKEQSPEFRCSDPALNATPSKDCSEKITSEKENSSAHRQSKSSRAPRRNPYPRLSSTSSRPVRRSAKHPNYAVDRSSSESPSPLPLSRPSSTSDGKSFSSAGDSDSPDSPTLEPLFPRTDDNVVYNKWTAEEDAILRAAVMRVTKNNTVDIAGKWVRIAHYVPNRTPIQCSARWSGALNRDIVRGKWTAREDSLLVAAVEREISRMSSKADQDPASTVDPSELNWQVISASVPGRTGVQCAARYQEALDPDVRKGKWLEEEDVLLKQGLIEFGKSWVKIAANIPNRTQRQCRTRWLQIYPKMSASEKAEMERQCGSPIAVNEKIKRKKKAAISGAVSSVQ